MNASVNGGVRRASRRVVACGAVVSVAFALVACSGGDTSAAYAGDAGIRPAAERFIASRAHTAAVSAPVLQAANPILTGEPVPRYDVLAAPNTDRPDGMVSYYIVIDAVDPDSVGFKSAVKQLLRVVASAVNPGPDFSAFVWDDLGAAQTELAYRSAPDRFSDEQLASKEDRNERHLIARYEGGLVSPYNPPAYVLSWFPHANNRSPEVGRWVGSEIWQP